MTTRKYSSRSQQTTLAAGITDTATSCTVVSGSALLGGATVPAGTTFTVVIDPDTALEEIVDITAVSTNVLTVTRGIENAGVGQAHSAGAAVRHMAIGRDFRDANLHTEATTAYNDGSGTLHTMHGIASGEGDVVGTDKTQTLTNKTLTSPAINNPTITGATVDTSIIFEGATPDAFETTLTVVDPTQDNTITMPNTTGTVVIANAAQTLTNKTIDMTGVTLTGLSSAGMSVSSATPKNYVDAILGSATAASTSAASAATSAASALTSQTSAATSATSAAASATAAATSATSAATSASSALTSANSASASATDAATSATSASASASAAATSATSSAASATAAATSATSAAASATASASSATAASSSAVVAASYASAAPEFRQYGAEGSVLNNIPTRVHDAESLLKQAVWWIDAAHSSASGQTISNLGWGGSALNATNGSSTSADSNDARYLDWDGRNYVYLPGVLSNSLSTPDASALDIAGDIDLRVQVAMDDWTPTTTSPLISKWKSGSDRSYVLRLNTDGTLVLIWSADGTTAITKTSTVANTFTDGTVKWVRATLDVDNGASGNDVKFYTSDDGNTWTQLGSTVTTAGVTSIFNSTQVVIVGQETDGTNVTAAKIYRAQICNGIDGVPVLDVDTSVITTGAATSFTALTGQTVTINRSTSGRKTTVVTHPVWLFGTDDYMEVNNRWLEHAAPSANYVYLNGATGNYMSIADNPPLDITGDLDLQVRVALDDWTPSTTNYLISKIAASLTQSSYGLRVATTGRLQLLWSADGVNFITTTSTVVSGITDGAIKWIRATLDVDNGAGGNDVKFFTSDNGTTWTQLGSTVTTAGTTSIFSGTAVVEIGSAGSGTILQAKGAFYRAIIKNGIDGTTVLDADASIITDGTASTFKERSSNAATVTINKSGTGTFASTNNYLYLPGVASNYASAPDSAALDITGDIDIRCKVALDDWTPSQDMGLLSKTVSGSSNFSCFLGITTTGLLQLIWSANGTTLIIKNSTVAPTIADGSTLWVRATLDVDNGASGNDVIFYTSTDGTTWTQLGTTVTTAGTTSIFSGTGTLGIGANNTSDVRYRGKFFRAQVLNGIGGTVAFDANFESSIVGNLPTTFTEGSTNAATVTVNYSGTAYRSCGVIASTYVYPGATNTFKLSSYSMLDFGASDSFSVVMAVRQWDTPVSNAYWMNKQSSATPYWYIRNQSTNYTTQYLSVDADGTVLSANGPTSAISGTLDFKTVVLDRTTSLVTSYRNAVGGTAVSTTGTDSLANPGSLRIGTDHVLSSYIAGEFVSAAIFRRALTAGEITTLNSYFQGRVN